VAKNTMLVQGISGKLLQILAGIFSMFGQKRFKTKTGSPFFCHEDVNNVKMMLISMTII
jgi:hypothetical protein